ncbi:MAG TPA: DNA primase [Ktedonobacteraceae bacterium]|nr:DNA primase [Ktedonobacteraceae bacterium]
MASVIETIKAKVDVVEEIGAVVVLYKSGKSLKGLCPFHNERTPSFYVFAESQTWHCFGCHEGGDVFSFVQKSQGLEFHEALLYLAEKAGVPVEEDSRSAEENREASAAKERLRKLNEDALLWFHQMLLRSKEASEARAYAQSRGMSSETVVAFSLGYAPNHWDGLSRYLLAQGYTERELVSGGLARERERSETGESGGVYDYFRNRLMFPIRDARGRVIGFGGRALGDGTPKYLNSPQTALFEKNNVLYALDMAKDAIKSAGQVVIVEGYVDAIIAHQYGTRQTVACIGSAITEKHIAQLKKLTRQVTLALDPDAAGASATEHGIQEALKGFDRTVVPVPMAASSDGRKSNGGKQKNGRNGQSEPRGIIRLEEQVDAEINVLQLPPGEDPDEFIRRDYPAWFYAVSHPLPLIDYYFVVKTLGLDLKQPNGQAEAARRLLPVIAMMSDRIKRDAYIRKLAAMISIDERSLYDGLQRVLRGQRSTGVTAEFSDGRRGSGVSSQARGNAGNANTISGSAPNWITESGEDEPDLAVGSSQQEKQRGPVVGLDRRQGSRVQWENYLIGLLLRNPGLSQHVCGIINDGDFAGTDTRELYRILNSINQRGSSSSNQPVEELVPVALLATVARARKSVERGALKDGAWQIKEAVQCATRLKRARLLQLNMDLQFLLRDAKTAGDAESTKQIQQQLLALQQQLRTIDSATHLQG